MRNFASVEYPEDMVSLVIAANEGAKQKRQRDTYDISSDVTIVPSVREI